MSSEQLSAIAGIILSLLFSYVPGLKDKFNDLTPTEKRIWMAAMLAAVAVGAFALSCGQIVDAMACTKDAAVVLVTNYIAALIANQSAFLISPKPQTWYAVPVEEDEAEAGE